MKTLYDCKDEIHSCSKCGLCQSVCPVYKITGNDCTVSRGHFIMLRGLIKGELKMSKTINRYLDLCLKCGACTDFCPSGIDIVDIVALAKAEYFQLHKREKVKSAVINLLIKSLDILKLFHSFAPKSKTFEKKVIYFGGCGAKAEGVSHIIKIFNSMNVEVIVPDFDCCGFPFFVKGDMKSFDIYMNKFYSVIEKYGDYDIVVNCATCEKTLKSYSKWHQGKEIKIRNVFEYIRENNLQLELAKPRKVTYHKPCNLKDFDNVKWVLENTKNLEYVEMKDYDTCCGMEGVGNLKERKIMSKLFRTKHENIKATKTKTVLTSCLACKMTLSMNSAFKYKVWDFADFLAKNIK